MEGRRRKGGCLAMAFVREGGKGGERNRKVGKERYIEREEMGGREREIEVELRREK